MERQLPPVEAELTSLLDKYLGHPEHLQVHHLERNQRFWPREINPENLFHTDVTPLQTCLQVERNPTTGELLGYKEVFLSNTGSTADNSTSLNRQPGLSTTVKGSSTNYPFWPGGLDEPEDLLTKEFDDVEELNFDELLSIPPGFQRGVEFERKSYEDKNLTSQPEKPAAMLDLVDLLAEDSGIIFSDDEDADVEEQHISQSMEEPASLECTENIDELVSGQPLLTEFPVITSEKKYSTQEESWAIPLDVNINVDEIYYKKILDPAYKWPFELDTFQKQAVLHLEEHDSVFIAAHTSAGKTVVAEYAIALSMKHMTRTIYTSPIKALSNQKFRDFKQTFGDVGLITGDVQLHPEAACLVMTTEILRSMLYNGSDVIRDLEWVVFDEVHYINDLERGVVWEEVLIMLPQHVSIILLSATVPNTIEFANWVGRTKKKKIYVISTTKRPVPLEHYLYTGNSNKTSNELFLLVDGNKNFLTQGYTKALEAKKERASKSSQSFGAKGKRQGNPIQDKNVWLSLIAMLDKKDRLPAIAFTFSKKKIEATAAGLTSVDLTTAAEKGRIHLFFQESISKLKKPDRELPQVHIMQELLKKGIGMHHSGILPILKEVVEMLFEKKLVKLLFATETFAMGVNVPSRTVLFDSTRKHDGTNFRDLLPGEYIQMAGRAGRRGLDPTGTVIILCKGDVAEMSDLHKMMLGKPTLLQSQFRLTYSMILNLLRVEQLRVEDMMKRSFAEFNNQKNTTKLKEDFGDLQKQVLELKNIECFWCGDDLEIYYKACQNYWQLKADLQRIVLSHPLAIKSLTPGRIIIVSQPLTEDTLGIILKSATNYKNERIFTTLVLREKVNGTESNNSSSTTNTSQSILSNVKPFSKCHLAQPSGPCSQEVLELNSNSVALITTKTLKVNADKILDDVKKRQIPRFRNDPPGQSTVMATQELIRILDNSPEGLPGLDPVQDLHMREIDLVEQFRTLQFLEEAFTSYKCTDCPSFDDHFEQMKVNMSVKDSYDHVKYLLSDDSLELLPEYKQRIEVLKELKYIDSMNTVQLKGRVACEMSTHELILTELVFENVLTDLHEADIAAILSCLVFEQKRCSEPNLNPDLIKGKNRVLDIANNIGLLQKKCGMLEPVDVYVDQFKFGLMEVVFEWARGMPFAEITKLTDVQEGIIVRCIQRLDETIKDVRNAARLIGDPILFQKMKDASAKIKRDIVFAASLYTQ